MKNPLIKRIPRELKNDIGKYIVIFLFMIMLVTLISSFLAADISVTAAFDEGLIKYNTEYGHFTLSHEPPKSLLDEIAEKADIRICDLRYFDEDIDGGTVTVRVYKNRSDMNIAAVLSGEMPSADNEIALDRLFANNNSISVGDEISLNGRKLVVSGFAALADYSAMFENNSDTMFNSNAFGVGIMTDSGFENFGSSRIKYNYAWTYNKQPSDDIAEKEMSDKLIDVLSDVLESYDESIIKAQTDAIEEKLKTAGEEYAKIYMTTGKAPEKSDLSVELSDFLFSVVSDSVNAEISGEEYKMPDEKAFEKEIDKSGIIEPENYIPRYANKSIVFAREDMGSDKAMFMLFDYIITVVLAFVFAITTSSTITAEAGVIGTLRASGFTRGELLRHYIILPVAVTLAAAIIGNILGYTVFINYMLDIYRNLESLASFDIVWSPEAFILTTVVPMVIVVIVNIIIIYSKLRLTPLQFLRRELKKKTRKKAVKLNTKIPFAVRFRLRIIIQNIPNYIVLITGIILGSVLLVFGIMMEPLMDDYSNLVIETRICDYQYILKNQAETDNLSAEKYSAESLETTSENFKKDEISIFGIAENSRYINKDIPSSKVLVSNGIADKYGLTAGDELTLKDPYSTKTYTFTIADEYTYDAALSVFMKSDDFNEMFGKDSGSFTGYFSNEPITDLAEDDIYTVVTVEDLDKVTEQLGSMIDFMKLFIVFGIAMFILLMYLLSKQIIERNFQSISMCKILGFRNSEIGGLYIASTSAVVILGLIAAVPACDAILRWAFSSYLYTEMTGYIPYIVRPSCFVIMVISGLVSYVAVAAFLLLKIKRIPKSEALKNVE